MKSAILKGAILPYRLEPEMDTLLASITTTTSNAWRRSANRLIKELKVAGAWSLCDSIWVLASETSQAALLDWKAPGGTALAVAGTTTFIPYRGYAGNATDGSLNAPTNYSALTQFQRNSAHISVWSCDTATGANYDMGVAGASNDIGIRCRNGADVFTATGPNQNGTTGTVTNGRGFFLIDRSGANATSQHYNGTQINSGAGASVAVVAQVPTILRTTTSFGSRRIGFASVGASAAAINVAFYAAVQRYMSDMGAGP
jgi:hypothetical protein